MLVRPSAYLIENARTLEVSARSCATAIAANSGSIAASTPSPIDSRCPTE
jgi:hypothetical protein